MPCIHTNQKYGYCDNCFESGQPIKDQYEYGLSRQCIEHNAKPGYACYFDECKDIEDLSFDNQHYVCIKRSMK